MTITRTALRHPRTGLPLLPVGYRKDGRPIMPILGAGPEEDDDFEPDPGSGDPVDDDDDEDDSDEDDSDDADDTAGKWTPPSKDEWETQQAALARANKQAKDRRLRIKELEKNGGKEPDEATLNARAEEIAGSTWKPLVVRSAAGSALAEAGLIGKPDRLVKLLDMDEIDVDPETGEIDGLSEQVADLRKEYPHLFRKRGTRNLDASDRGEKGSKREKMTASEIQAAALRGEL